MASSTRTRREDDDSKAVDPIGDAGTTYQENIVEEEGSTGPPGLTSIVKLNNYVKSCTKTYKDYELTDRDLYAAYYVDFKDWRLQD